MIRKFIFNSIAFLLVLTIFTTSCKKFLDIKPQDRILENEIFSQEANINKALNGIYLDIAKPALYGGNLTMSTIDIMAQYYNASSGSNLGYREYNYLDPDVLPTTDLIWTYAYKNILNVNNFIQKLEITNGVVSADHKDLLLGEAYGLRAFLHFDLLRLYGPVYKKDPQLLAIPYLTSTSVNERPFLSADQVIAKVILDLIKATELLQNDPIRVKGIEGLTGTPLEDFYKMRNRRLNYFAAKALMARVKLYSGDKKGAHDAALEVINTGGSLFPWTDPAKVISDPLNPDKIFSSEVIFGLQNADMYNQQRQLFAPTLSDRVILAPITEQLNSIFKENQKDYRYDPSWKTSSLGGKAYRTFFKFDDVEDRQKTFRMFQPLIRISELYYIASETADDASSALGYLNTVRRNRGLADLTAAADIENEIRKEYRREFIGEGQLFFYYKRLALTSIPSGDRDGDLIMVLKNYSLPIPASETQNR